MVVNNIPDAVDNKQQKSALYCNDINYYLVLNCYLYTYGWSMCMNGRWYGWKAHLYNFRKKSKVRRICTAFYARKFKVARARLIFSFILVRDGSR